MHLSGLRNLKKSFNLYPAWPKRIKRLSFSSHSIKHRSVITTDVLGSIKIFYQRGNSKGHKCNGLGSTLRKSVFTPQEMDQVKFRSPLPDVQRIPTDQGHKWGMPYGLWMFPSSKKAGKTLKIRAFTDKLSILRSEDCSPIRQVSYYFFFMQFYSVFCLLPSFLLCV